MSVPVPTELKRKRGNPGKRSLPAKSNQTLTPISSEPPKHLGPSGADLWTSLADLGASWIAFTDSPTILLLCESWDRRAEMLEVIAEEGLTLESRANGRVKHPLLSEVVAIEKQIASMFSSLGLTPADRSRLGLQEVKAASKLEQLRASRQSDNA